MYEHDVNGESIVDQPNESDSGVMGTDEYDASVATNVQIRQLKLEIARLQERVRELGGDEGGDDGVHFMDLAARTVEEALEDVKRRAHEVDAHVVESRRVAELERTQIIEAARTEAREIVSQANQTILGDAAEIERRAERARLAEAAARDRAARMTEASERALAETRAEAKSVAERARRDAKRAFEEANRRAQATAQASLHDERDRMAREIELMSNVRQSLLNERQTLIGHHTELRQRLEGLAEIMVDFMTSDVGQGSLAEIPSIPMPVLSRSASDFSITPLDEVSPFSQNDDQDDHPEEATIVEESTDPSGTDAQMNEEPYEPFDLNHNFRADDFGVHEVSAEDDVDGVADHVDDGPLEEVVVEEVEAVENHENDVDVSADLHVTHSPWTVSPEDSDDPFGSIQVGSTAFPPLADDGQLPDPWKATPANEFDITVPAAHSFAAADETGIFPEPDAVEVEVVDQDMTNPGLYLPIDKSTSATSETSPEMNFKPLGAPAAPAAPPSVPDRPDRPSFGASVQWPARARFQRPSLPTFEGEVPTKPAFNGFSAVREPAVADLADDIAHHEGASDDHSNDDSTSEGSYGDGNGEFNDELFQEFVDGDGERDWQF